MDLHPYDGKERRFQHTDADPGPGLHVVMRLLRLPEPPRADGLLYDLSFWSGGMGTIDKLAITLPLRAAPTLPRDLSARPLAECVANPPWDEELLWLLADGDERNAANASHDARRFINERRAPFQPPCAAADPIWFDPSSGVNTWTALWRSGEQLNFLSYDQG